MRTLLANKTKHYKNFADSVTKLYRQMRYGIDSCKPEMDLDLALIRKEIVDWQADEDASALSQTAIQYQTWLGITYDDVLYPSGGVGYVTTNNATGPVLFNYSNNYTQNGQNVIEINSGGCITKINLNPSMIVNTGGGNTEFSYNQTIPSTVWTINHNLGFVPNVTTVNSSNQEIVGVITTLTTTTVVIEFSDALTGYAYLS